MTQWGLDTLFNPAKRHMDEEKRRLQSTREEVGDNSGGKRIDLESGKVRIESAEDGAEEEKASRTSRRVSRAGRTGEARKTERPQQGEPTPAQIRAAARRGRKLDQG